MNSESQPGLPSGESKPEREQPPTALDAERYAELREAIAWQAYEYFAGDEKVYRIEEEKKTFADPNYIPRLDYPKLKPDSPEFARIKEREKVLAGARERIRRENPSARKIMSEGWPADVEPNEQTVVDVAYLLRINEKLAEARLVQVASQLDQLSLPEDAKPMERPQLEEKRRTLSKRFESYTSMLYGEPSKDIAGWSVARMRARNRALLSRSDDSQVREAVEALDRVLPTAEVLPPAKVYELPTKEQYAQLRAELEQQFDRFLKLPAEKVPGLIELPEGERGKRELTSQEQLAVIESALKEFAPNWTAEIEEGRSTYSVSQERERVIVPSKPRTYDKFIQVYVHEVLTHVWRRGVGEASDLKLLGAGLRGYEQGEEGLTTLREDIIGGKPDLRPEVGHLAIALARGVDGKPRTFREVYDFLYTYGRVRFEVPAMLKKYDSREAKDKALAVAKADAREGAFGLAVRTFRGTDLRARGVCFTKDIIYGEGRSMLYRTIKQKGEQGVPFTRMLNIGKLDLSGVEEAESGVARPKPRGLRRQSVKAGVLAAEVLSRHPAFDKRMREAGIDVDAIAT